MAAPNASMLELSHIISDRTAKLNDFLTKKQLPPPSFAEDAPNPDYIPTDERAACHLRNELVEASQRLAFLAQGPKTNVLEQAFWRVRLPRVMFYNMLT